MENKRNNSTSQIRLVEAITWHDIDLTVTYTINYFAWLDIEAESKEWKLHEVASQED